MDNEELNQQNGANNEAVPEKYIYSLKFSPDLYKTVSTVVDNETVYSQVLVDEKDFKDSYEFKVKYEVAINPEYFEWTKTHYIGPDGLPLYEKIEDIPVPTDNKYLFRASLEELEVTGSGSSAGEDDEDENLTEGDETGDSEEPSDEPSSDTIEDSGIKYVLEKNGYKITQPSNGTFIITTDGTSTESQSVFIYLVDPHTELYGTDEAYEEKTITVKVPVGKYDENRNRYVDPEGKEEEKTIMVLKNPTDLEENVLDEPTELVFNGVALPDFAPNTVTYEDADISDGELVMKLADGFTTDDIQVYTYPFSLNLVPGTVTIPPAEGSEEDPTEASAYISDLNAVRPGIYQVYAVYKGQRFRLRDLKITGCNILNTNMKLESEQVEGENNSTSTTYFYNANVGEVILLNLYSNPRVDTIDTQFGIVPSNSNEESNEGESEEPKVTIETVKNCTGCFSAALLHVKDYVADPVLVQAIDLTPAGEEDELASRFIKVIPLPQEREYTAPVEFPASNKIMTFDDVVDIFRYADGRRVFSTEINKLTLYQIVTNEYEVEAEYEFEYAMTLDEFVRI